MPVMDEFREEREALKHGTPKQKFAYFLDYYKWYVVVAIVVMVFIGSLIYQALTHKDIVFYAALVNVFEMDSNDEHARQFAEYAGVDTDEYEIVFDSSLHIDTASMDQETITSTQKLMVYIAASEIDVLMMDGVTLEQYAYNETLTDLREVLSPEQIEAYEPYFFYMDQAVADAISAAQENPDYDYSIAPTHPDPKNPEAMEQPIPVGIYLDNAASFKENNVFIMGDGVISVAATSPNREIVPMYIDFVLQRKITY